MDNVLQNFSMDFFSLKGKVAIVTGGNTGIGQGYSVALAKAGCDIFVPAFDSNVDETKAMVEAEGRKFEFIQGDLTKADFREETIKACIEKLGRVDILVNNAGMILRAPIFEHTYEMYNKVVELNQNAVYHLSQLAAIEMKKQGGGKIVNIASMLSFQGGKFVPGYTASKHAVAGLTKIFASELAADNIQVNAIAPGYIESANTAPIMADPERNKSIVDRIPVGEWGKPYDLMGTVVFLSSRASDYVNGHILAVDGGWLTR